MEILGWLLIVSVVICISVAPAFPSVRRRLGLADDTPEAQAVRRFVRSPLKTLRGGGEYPPGEFERTSHRRIGAAHKVSLLAYPQQPVTVDGRGTPTLATDLELLQRDKATFAQTGDRWAEANVLNLIGFVRERSSRFDEAAATHAQALELFRAIGDPAGISDSLNDLGVVLARLGRTDEAMARHLEALALREKLDEARVANSHNNLGVVLSRNQPDEARAHFAHAEMLARAAGDNRGLGKIVNNKTVLDLDASGSDDFYADLCKEFERSLTLRAASEDQRGNAKTHNNLGIVHALWGKPGNAERYFREAATLAGNVEDNVGLLHVLENWLLLIDSYENRRERPERIADRIASRLDEVALSEAVLEADREAYPTDFGAAYPERGQIALLSSGSATPATSAMLHDRLGEGNPAA